MTGDSVDEDVASQGRPDKKPSQPNKKKAKASDVPPIAEAAATPKQAHSKRKGVPIAVKSAVWHNYYGDAGKAACYVCNRIDIYRDAFEVAHVRARAKGASDEIRNLRPCCSQCNKSIGTDDLDESSSASTASNVKMVSSGENCDR